MSDIAIDCQRSIKREVYYELHRLARIAARDSREASEAAMNDLVCVGSAMVLVEPHTGPKGQFAKCTAIHQVETRDG